MPIVRFQIAQNCASSKQERAVQSENELEFRPVAFNHVAPQLATDRLWDKHRTAITLLHHALQDRKGNADRFRTNPDCPETLPTRTVTLVVNLPVRPVASIAELFLFLTDPDNGAGPKVDG